MRRSILLLLVAVLASCGVEAEDPDTTGSSGGMDGTRQDRQPEVVARDGELLLIHEDGERERLGRLSEGHVEHVAVRPGDHDELTVLALALVEDRYELRYLVVDEDGPSDLYGFPWRLQIAPDLDAHGDLAPVPVWAPDGSAVAWLEWDGDSTRLRTVGWMDADGANNPSDDAATYRVREVPVGARLEAWELDRPGSVLVADDGEVEWRIELSPGGRAVAMPVALASVTGSAG